MAAAFTSVFSMPGWSVKKKHKKEEWERLCRLTRIELEQEFVQKAEETWQMSWDILMKQDGWKQEAGSTPEDGLVYSQTFPKLGKLFKLEGMVEAPPELVFEVTVLRLESHAQWNPTVLEGKTLQAINENTDISYNVAAEGAGGLVASRDFVNLRHWKTKDGIILSSGCAVMHPDAPPTKKYVRGENKAGGWSYFPVEGEPGRCRFCWILSTDLKGWVPQYAVDTALASTLRDFLRHLQNHVLEVQKKEGR